MIGLFLLCTSALSQTISLSAKNAPLESVLKEIEKQTGYSVIWNEKQLEQISPVTLQVTRTPLLTLLTQLLAPRGLTYKMAGKVIVIKSNPLPVHHLSQASPLPAGFYVSGIIKNESGAPVAGASIIVKGYAAGAVSEPEGSFHLKTNIGERVLLLAVSCQGYKPAQLNATNGRQLNIVLEQNIAALNDVVVATGIFDRKKETYTGAAVTLTAEDLATAGNRNLLISLQQLDPSINIIENNNRGSDPNQLPEVQIRGNSGIPNVNEIQTGACTDLNTPLVMLDGAESSLQRIIDMNQEEVLSVTILKDAAATAIYGSRGANGVIVVKTKPATGSREGKLQVSYRGDISIQLPDLNSYHVLKARDKLELEKLAGLYNGPDPARDLELKKQYNFLAREVTRGVETDWLAKPLQNAVGQKHNLVINGGGQVFRYATAIQWKDIQGIMQKSLRRTFNADLKLAYHYGNVQLLNTTGISLGNSENSTSGSFSEYVKMNPYWYPYDTNGNPVKLLGDSGEDFYGVRWQATANPLYNASLNSFNKGNTSFLFNNFSVSWNITSSLTLKGLVALNKTREESKAFLSAAYISFNNTSLLQKGTYNDTTDKKMLFDGLLSLEYTKKINKHRIYAGLSASSQEKRNSEALTRAVGITTNLNYSFMEKYFVDFSARIDGNSQFGAATRFAPFWSVGAGLNLHKMSLVRQVPFINRLVVRGSTGIVGSQNFQPYQSLRTYRYYTGDTYFSWTGTRLVAMGNDDLRWQQERKNNLGIDAEIADGRFKMSADCYIETTHDLISSVNLPASNGFPEYIQNMGKVQNRGTELSVTCLVLRNKKQNITWSVTAGMAYNQNKIISISQALKDAQSTIEAKAGTGPVKLYREGYADNTIWAVPSMGIDPGTGKELYVDEHGNPGFTWSPLYLQAAGIDGPKYRGNFSSLLRYGSFSATIMCRYRLGGQLYNQTLSDRVENANFKYNTDSRVLENRWKQPGDYAAFKGLLVTTPTYTSSRFVFNERTLELANVHLAYELNTPFVQAIGIQRLLFAADVADCFYFSTVLRERGIDFPFSRQISLTINASF